MAKPDTITHLWPSLYVPQEVDIVMTIPAVTSATYTITAGTQYDSILHLWAVLDAWCTAHADPDINDISWTYAHATNKISISYTGGGNVEIIWDDVGSFTEHRDAANFDGDLSGSATYQADGIGLVSDYGPWTEKTKIYGVNSTHYQPCSAEIQVGGYQIQGSTGTVDKAPTGCDMQWLLSTSTERDLARKVFVGNGDYEGLSGHNYLSRYDDIANYDLGADDRYWLYSTPIKFMPRRQSQSDKRNWVIDLDLIKRET